MRVEEICLRQEIRQMLNEAGIDKNTLKEMVKRFSSLLPLLWFSTFNRDKVGGYYER